MSHNQSTKTLKEGMLKLILPTQSIMKTGTDVTGTPSEITIQTQSAANQKSLFRTILTIFGYLVPKYSA